MHRLIGEIHRDTGINNNEINVFLNKSPNNSMYLIKLGRRDL